MTDPDRAPPAASADPLAAMRAGAEFWAQGLRVWQDWMGAAVPAVVDPATDKRFRGDAWRRPPFDGLARAYLAMSEKLVAGAEATPGLDAAARETSAACCVRRSRVVLAPRCWRQVLKKLALPGGDGGNKAGHRGERVISRKTIAQGRPGCSRRTCMLVCTFALRNSTRYRGCGTHPVFPAPS